MGCKIYYLFSRNPLIGSRLIAWFSGLLVSDLEKIPSHMAVLVEQEGSVPLVFESTFASGVRIMPYSNWLTINEECYKIPCGKIRSQEEVFGLVKEYWGKKYDWQGVLYFVPCFISHLFFKTPFPKVNKWQQEDRYFCNEIGGILANYPNYSMVTPAKMCLDFLRMQNGEAKI